MSLAKYRTGCLHLVRVRVIYKKVVDFSNLFIIGQPLNFLEEVFLHELGAFFRELKDL
jgi:hypothetical protein